MCWGQVGSYAEQDDEGWELNAQLTAITASENLGNGHSPNPGEGLHVVSTLVCKSLPGTSHGSTASLVGRWTWTAEPSSFSLR